MNRPLWVGSVTALVFIGSLTIGNLASGLRAEAQQPLPINVIHSLATFTPEQLAVLKTDLVANHAGQDDETAANSYQVIASPDYWVWKTFVGEAELQDETSSADTTWSWTIFIARSQGERDAWRQMVSMRRGLNPSLANVRAGVADIFSGAGGANQRAHLLAMGRKRATVGQKLFAVATVGGSGTRGSTSNPDTMVIEDPITVQNVSEARNLP